MSRLGLSLFALLLALAGGGCDTSPSSDKPESPDPSTDFFPLSVGSTWTYDFGRLTLFTPSGDIGSDSIDGLLRWQISDITQVDTVRVITFVETTSADLFTWTETDDGEAWVEGDSLLCEKTFSIRMAAGSLYGRKRLSSNCNSFTATLPTPLPRYVETDGDTLRLSISEGAGHGVSDFEVHLVRGKGVISLFEDAQTCPICYGEVTLDLRTFEEGPNQ